MHVGMFMFLRLRRSMGMFVAVNVLMGMGTFHGWYSFPAVVTEAYQN